MMPPAIRPNRAAIRIFGLAVRAFIPTARQIRPVMVEAMIAMGMPVRNMGESKDWDIIQYFLAKMDQFYYR